MNNHECIDIIKWVLSSPENNNDNFFNNEYVNSINWEDIYSFFSSHAIVSLFSDVIKYIPKEYSNLKQKWQKSVCSNIYEYSRITDFQKKIFRSFVDANISIAVVKGTSAAKYYSKPYLRTTGDIDLLVKPVDYERAVCCLLDINCREITCPSELEMGRHRSFRFKDFSIELHHYFSLNVSEDKAKILDNQLFSAISSNCVYLPDEENGLVLLSHIRQHLESGIGLRQIIDWMMFVRSFLDNEKWYSSFQEKAHITGLDNLAIITTKMCQKYLGLTTVDITWCESADDTVCDILMDYIMCSGNFGRSRDLLQSENLYKAPSIKHPIQLFKYIQKRGEIKWRVLNAHPYLKPFAWIYQLYRYVNMAVHNKVGAKKIKNIYDEGKKRNELFVALGIK